MDFLFSLGDIGQYNPHPLEIAAWIVGAVTVFYFLFILINGFDLKETTQLGIMSLSIMQMGYSNIFAFSIIKSIIKKYIARHGYLIKSFGIVHELEGRYRGLITTKDGKKIDLFIVADTMGHLRWTWQVI